MLYTAMISSSAKRVDRVRQLMQLYVHGPLMNISNMPASGSCRSNDPFSVLVLITTAIANTLGASLIIVPAVISTAPHEVVFSKPQALLEDPLDRLPDRIPPICCWQDCGRLGIA